MLLLSDHVAATTLGIGAALNVAHRPALHPALPEGRTDAPCQRAVQLRHPDMGGQFNNPSRQPIVNNTRGCDNFDRGLATGRCAGAIIPTAVPKQLGADELIRGVLRGGMEPRLLPLSART